MNISVVVCTHNRAKLLRPILESLINQDYPANDYEVIVVDNNSSDSTKEIVEEIKKTQNGNAVKASSPKARNNVQLRYVLEEKTGLSYARNRGIEEAKGDIIAFIDDDATADRSWLSILSRVYQEENKVGCVGGQIKLDWKYEQPTWWQPELDETFNRINYSEKRIELSHPRYPYGTNISFSANVLHQVGLFGTDLGRIGSRLLAGEETEICLRIEREGYRILYEPNALVYHQVDPDKVTRKYIRKRAIWHGRSHAMIEFRHFGREHVLSKTQYFIKKIIGWIASGRYSLVQQSRNLFVFGYILEGMKIKYKNDKDLYGSA